MRATAPFRRVPGLLFYATLVCHGPAVVHAQGVDPMSRASVLLESKDAAGAYSLLEPLEARRAPDPAFSYLLGIAALESGRLERAALALERTLAINPEHDSARAALGRTYLRMGALDLAEREFELLLDRPLDASAKAAVRAYLAEISVLKARARFRVETFAEAGVGRDSNITATTRDFTSAVQGGFGLPGIAPTGNSIRRADAFSSLGAGVEGLWRPREDHAYFASAGARARNYRDYRDFDYRLLDVSAGAQARIGESSYLASIFGQDFRQDGALTEGGLLEGLSNDRRAAGVQLEWRREAWARTEVVASFQAAALRFADNPGQDSNQYQLALGLQHSPRSWGPGALDVVAYATLADALRPLNPFTDATGAHKTYGVRITARSDVRARLSWMVAGGVSRRIDDDEFARATLVKVGRDTLGEIHARVGWRFTGHWSAQAWVSGLRNRSNIELYSFRKAEGGVDVRFDYP